jgi:hypothetical protein
MARPTLWSALHEQWIRDLMHVYRISLDAATSTMHEERKKLNLRHAERVRERLRNLIEHAALPAATRAGIEAQLADLDERRAVLCTGMLMDALSQMYPPKGAS